MKSLKEPSLDFLLNTKRNFMNELEAIKEYPDTDSREFKSKSRLIRAYFEALKDWGEEGWSRLYINKHFFKEMQKEILCEFYKDF